jgi:hypothetical protein
LSCWTSHFLLVPIHLETACIEPLLLFRLPLVIGPRWRYQVDAIRIPALDTLFCFRILGVGQVLFGQHIFFFKGMMDEWGHIPIPIACTTGLYLRNQAGSTFITTFSQMDFVG